MARISLTDPRVQEVQKRLLPVYLARGTVNAIAETLNDALGASTGSGPKVIYPHRLHHLFSDDPSRALRLATVEDIERALDAISLDSLEPSGPQARRLEDWRRKVRQYWQVSDQTTDELKTLADQLALPPIVVRHLIEQAGLDGPKQETSKREIAPDASEVPDRSFQDTAVRRCLEIARDPANLCAALIVPTGGGKTRIAIRVALEVLSTDPSAKVVWVTHRRNLKHQAFTELQKMMDEGVPGIPDDALLLLAERLEFIMVGEIEDHLSASSAPPALVIVDEAHHQAARSYDSIFDAKRKFPVLSLTATPNRTDGVPIRIDRVAYSITYKELVDRKVILMPEFRPFPVRDFTWSPEQVRDLAEELLKHSKSEYKKVLVIAPRIDRVRDFHAALVEKLRADPSPILTEDDLGYVDSSGNSKGFSDNQDFIDEFSAKRRGILVSAQMLLEGFDDPSIDAVVITYPSQSLIVLMQAAGRCVRVHPGKKHAYVIQAKQEALAYYFDQRWLIQEISDFLRPDLVDIEYTSAAQLQQEVTSVLDLHRVNPRVRARILGELSGLKPGEVCKLMLSGLPYYGESFSTEATWSALLETSANTEQFKHTFNEFCARGAETREPDHILGEVAKSYGLTFDERPDSDWRMYMDMYLSMIWAKKEIHGDGCTSPEGRHRPYEKYKSTTWLRYFTFKYVPLVSPALEAFLSDAFNREDLIREYAGAPAQFRGAIKIPLPLFGTDAHLLTDAQSDSLEALLEALRTKLTGAPQAEHLGILAKELCQAGAMGIPNRYLSNPSLYLRKDWAGQYRIDLKTTEVKTQTQGEI